MFAPQDIGIGKGKNHSVNFPLRDGITDEAYKSVFEPVGFEPSTSLRYGTNFRPLLTQVISQIMEWYRPSAVVLQCGGDSLSGDRIGTLNLSMRGHANCVQFIKSFGLPLLILGGGGYTIRNVSRTWAFETGLAAGQELGSGKSARGETGASSLSLISRGHVPLTEIPMNEYYEYFGPTYQLDVPQSNTDDHNTREYLEKIKTQVFENLRHTGSGAAPSVQMQREFTGRLRARGDKTSGLTCTLTFDSVQLFLELRWTTMTMWKKMSEIRMSEEAVSWPESSSSLGATVR